MSRVFRPQSAATERRKLLQSLALAVSVSKQSELDRMERRDLMAFSLQILNEIANSVKLTVSAWEKRGYWVKADRFMAEWQWVESSRLNIEEAYRKDGDWPQPAILDILEKHLATTTPPSRLLKDKPWKGAWSRGEVPGPPNASS